MVRGTLPDRFLNAGRRLVELLDAADVDLRAALWLYKSEPGGWVLLLGFPGVGRLGPLAFYGKVQGVFAPHRRDLHPLRFEDITVMDTEDPLVRGFRDAVHIEPGVPETRFEGGRVGDTYVENALIYRMQ